MMIKTFTVNGMKCVHCKANVESALKGLNGVSNAVVSLENKNVEVEYDENIISNEALKVAVDTAGHFEMIL